MIGKDENEWVSLAANWVNLEIKPGQKVFVPAGGTPQPLYRRWVREPNELLRSLKLLQIDDILNGPQKGTFKKFFHEELQPYLHQIEWITKADQTADVAILGVGVNGHVAFHEPQMPRHFDSGCVRLSSETLAYLNLEDPTWGVTYGVGAFLKAKKILVMAKGEKKERILKIALKEKNLPISYILEHPNVTLITDFRL